MSVTDADRRTSLRVVDSHTGGEPTRVVVEGLPEFSSRSMLDLRDELAREYDWIRTLCIGEPRGFDAVVGAVLCESERDDCEAGVVFFNNVGCLWGCLHGTIGVIETLVYLGRAGEGEIGLETPVGVVRAQVDTEGRVTVRNVRSYRYRKAVSFEVAGIGTVTGDIAWGGNWFFLVTEGSIPAIEIGNVEALSDFAWRIRQALGEQGITGEDGLEIDHIEIFGPPSDPADSDSKNFVLCPGKAYDRSPCGTGTSAKLACLHADGVLGPGQTWRQAGILDAVFEGEVEVHEDGGVIPIIRGRAYITAVGDLVSSPGDPFPFGILPD